MQLEKVPPGLGKEVVEQRWQNVLEGAAGHGQGPWQGWLSGVGLEGLGTGALSLGAWALYGAALLLATQPPVPRSACRGGESQPSWLDLGLR